jgi:NAD(P)-dependent dehydrogenase (short-subunit alcohol dehydrogenase family)
MEHEISGGGAPAGSIGEEFLASFFGLKGRVALVTGGSRGIGFMIASGLVRAGATVFIVARDRQNCETTAADLGGPAVCTPIVGDIASPASIAQVVAALEAAGGRLDILVNNAATAWAAPLASYPAAAWDKVLSVNLTSVFMLSQACLPLLKASASPEAPSRIINVGSVDGIRVPAFETYAYSASKAGLHHLTRSLAQALGPDHVTVNAIAPGTFPTKLTADMLARDGASLVQRLPLRRLGRSDDIAGTAVFLASRASAYVTGQIIAVDGGMSTTPW